MSVYRKEDRSEDCGYADAEERARTWWENGELGNPPANLGNEMYGCLIRAAYGDEEARRASKLRSQVDRREYLSFSDVRKLYNAASFASALNQPLNEFWTLSWAAGGVEGDAAGAECFDRAKAALRKHCRTAGLPDGLIYVHEKGREFGFHTHVLLHVSVQDRRDRRAFVQQHITGLLGKEALAVKRRLSDGKEIKLFSHRTTSGQSLGNQLDFQWRAFRYLLKGVYEHERVPEVGRGLRPRNSVCEVFDLRRDELRKSLRLDFEGPRAGVTHSLAGGAQKRAGFVSALERGKVAGSRLYDPEFYVEYERERQTRELLQKLATISC